MSRADLISNLPPPSPLPPRQMSVDRSNFAETSQAAEGRCDAAIKLVDEHDFDEDAVLELDAFDMHLVQNTWKRFADHCKASGYKTKRFKLTPEEMDDKPQAKRRRVMNRVLVAVDNDALKQYIAAESE